MRVIGMLLGIPVEEQVRLRDHILGTRDMRDSGEITLEESLSGSLFAEFIDSRIESPRDDIMTQLLNAEFENEHGEKAQLQPRGVARVREHHRLRWQRDDSDPHRVGHEAAG